MGRPKTNKITNSISMSPEAWAILHATVTDRKTSKSAYLESLVIRGDNRIYDEVSDFLVTQYAFTERKIRNIEKNLEDLKQFQQASRKFMLKVGIPATKISGVTLEVSSADCSQSTDDT
jgi:hypothetical protein